MLTKTEEEYMIKYYENRIVELTSMLKIVPSKTIPLIEEEILQYQKSLKDGIEKLEGK